MLDRVTDSVGAIVRRSDGVVLGSCLSIEANRVLTVPHVIEDVFDLHDIYILMSGKVVDIEGLSRSLVPGTAVLIARAPSIMISDSADDLTVCNIVYVAGWPQLRVSDPHSGPRVIRSSIMRQAYMDNSLPYFEIQGTFPKGFSGGAILNAKGLLIGLLDELCALEVAKNVSFSFGLARPLRVTARRT